MSCLKFISRFANKSLIKNSLIQSSVTGVRNRSSEPDWVPKDPETHTGQKWDENDYRLARFVDRPKQINEQFAIDLIAEEPPKACKDRVICCDGGHDHTGHPRVYINLDKPGCHACGYCGLRYYREDQH